MPLQSLYHRHFARKSLLHRSYLPSIGQTSTLGSSANRDTNCLIIYPPVFSIAFWFLMSSSGERLHQNLKSYPLVTLANDGTICVILKKICKLRFFFSDWQRQGIQTHVCWSTAMLLACHSSLPTHFQAQGWHQFNQLEN